MQQLAILIQSGLPLEEALKVTTEQAETDSQRRMLQSWRSEINEGRSFSDALSRSPYKIPDSVIAGVGVGEESGHLHKVLQRLAEDIETSAENRKTLARSLIYPFALLATSLVVVVIMMIWVVPKITIIFANSDRELPLVTQLVMGLSNFTTEYGIYVLVIFFSVLLFFKKLLPSIFSSGVTQINILIGTIIASFQAGAVSYLYYADRIYQINLAIAGIAIGTVILPKLSSYIAQKKLKDIDLIQNKSLELSFFLSLPAMAGLLIASEEIVSSLFGYGSFNKEGVENSAKALFYFALGLPAFSLIKILSNFIFARDNTKIPFFFSLISVIINASISIYYFRDFGFIVIPIATSISSWINALLLYYYLNYKKFFKVSLSLIFQFFKISFSVLLMALFLFTSINFFSVQLEYDSNFKVIYLLLLVISSAIIYFAISLLTKAFKLSDIKIRY